MAEPPIYAVALPVPLRKTFDYLAWDPLFPGPIALPGCRVQVSFGNQQLTGVITSVKQSSELPASQLKAILQLLDQQPLVPTEVLQLCQWTAHYYHHPLGDVLATALPVQLRQGAAARLVEESAWRLTDAGRHCSPAELARAPRQQELLAQLQALQTEAHHDALPLWHKDLLASGIKRPQLQALADKGLLQELQLSPAQLAADLPPLPPLREPHLPLNSEQQLALRQVEPGRFQCHLLYGTTGSGKTEVYLQAIDKVLAAGQQALVLIPEIGLTPQTLRRFQQRFQRPMAILHSGLNDSERQQAWLLAAQGLADIIIGTRSAIFTPLPRGGIIIVDEEHDGSFKQQDGLRYSARDLAAVRCQQLGIPLLLGSATPSLESYHNARSGRYQMLPLTQRAGGAQPPAMETIDIRGLPLQDGFSEPLLEHMRSHLQQGNQVLAFLNRRGYAPTLMCHDCGWMAQCPACDARLTVHQHPSHLHCHHCDYQRPLLQQCPNCRSYQLQPLGQGTERAEQRLQALFPDIPVVRVDRDTTRRKNAMEEIVSRVHQGEPCILLGTQMLAKGHHFPDVTLVAILDVDGGLFSTDFRGPERMGQLLLQVAGRAGRADKPGSVLIQTHLADHPLLQTLLHQGYSTYADILLQERQTASLPPFRYMALLRAESSRPENAHGALLQARQWLEQRPDSRELQCLGPLPAPMEKRNDRYRYQLQLQSPNRAHLHLALQQLIPQMDQSALAKRVRWSVDVDPQDMT
ncbi:primosomal protein N' [Pseudomaricurvus sp. HS19]|uniref:primosomal protein N' n=1 Tax=Pseudomaricurvus sp. HS19 TaxID=2692626 RepID=UPI00136B22B4|nr:primosomal protein N' [Pseudomaricurvus sp. HS19]MYM63584.1 primosomal protein N' [Pseudomaricurvus sp. HS19]